MSKVLFVCTSNKDRSPALVEYFSEIFPQNEYRSAGINNFYCKKKGTHLIDVDDIKWCDLLVFCEDIHFNVVNENFMASNIVWAGSDPEVRIDTNSVKYIFLGMYKEFVILNCGEYKQGCIGEDYLTKAQSKLQRLLSN